MMDDSTLAESSEIPVDYETDCLLRNYGCELIQKAGILLQLNAETVATGQTIVHRFYLRRSLREFDIRPTSATACFLASKLQENIRKVKDVARVFDFLVNHENDRREPIHHLDELFTNEIVRIEREILVEFGFRLDSIVVSPHRYVLQYIYALFRDIEEYSNHRMSDIAKKSWGYINDCMRSNLCCKISPGVIAVGCIYMAAKVLVIPLTKESGWYKIFDATWDDIMFICRELDHVYSMGTARYVDLSAKQTAPSDDQSFLNIESLSALQQTIPEDIIKQAKDSTSGNVTAKVTTESSSASDRDSHRDQPWREQRRPQARESTSSRRRDSDNTRTPYHRTGSGKEDQPGRHRNRGEDYRHQDDFSSWDDSPFGRQAKCISREHYRQRKEERRSHYRRHSRSPSRETQRRKQGR